MLQFGIRKMFWLVNIYIIGICSQDFKLCLDLAWHAVYSQSIDMYPALSKGWVACVGGNSAGSAIT